MKTEVEIRRAVELLKADCERLRKRGGAQDVASSQDAMRFALEWALGEENLFGPLLGFIERSAAEAKACGK